MSKGKLFVISGASGVGKSTILKQVMAAREDLTFSVSATTRAPRPDEVDGVHYYFIDRCRFEDMIHRGEFLEYDEHHEILYGTPAAQVLEKQEQGHVILDIEPNGAFNVRKSRPDATLIFIMPLLMENKTMAVYTAEPVADVLAVAFTATLFAVQFKKALKKIS